DLGRWSTAPRPAAWWTWPLPTRPSASTRSARVACPSTATSPTRPRPTWPGSTCRCTSPRKRCGPIPAAPWSCSRKTKNAGNEKGRPRAAFLLAWNDSGSGLGLPAGGGDFLGHRLHGLLDGALAALLGAAGEVPGEEGEDRHGQQDQAGDRVDLRLHAQAHGGEHL